MIIKIEGFMRKLIRKRDTMSERLRERERWRACYLIT